MAVPKHLLMLKQIFYQYSTPVQCTGMGGAPSVSVLSGTHCSVEGRFMIVFFLKLVSSGRGEAMHKVFLVTYVYSKTLTFDRRLFLFLVLLLFHSGHIQFQRPDGGVVL